MMTQLLVPFLSIIQDFLFLFATTMAYLRFLPRKHFFWTPFPPFDQTLFLYSPMFSTLVAKCGCLSFCNSLLFGTPVHSRLSVRVVIGFGIAPEVFFGRPQVQKLDLTISPNSELRSLASLFDGTFWGFFCPRPFGHRTRLGHQATFTPRLFSHVRRLDFSFTPTNPCFFGQGSPPCSVPSQCITSKFLGSRTSATPGTPLNGH